MRLREGSAGQRHEIGHGRQGTLPGAVASGGPERAVASRGRRARVPTRNRTHTHTCTQARHTHTHTLRNPGSSSARSRFPTQAPASARTAARRLRLGWSRAPGVRGPRRFQPRSCRTLVRFPGSETRLDGRGRSARTRRVPSERHGRTATGAAGGCSCTAVASLRAGGPRQPRAPEGSAEGRRCCHGYSMRLEGSQVHDAAASAGCGLGHTVCTCGWSDAQ